jgi:NAD(P)-dependent dehydrogenase (short-subunit alcohol dehydrogenase family)
MLRKVALVTGASRGIGKASALALAEAGFDVVVTARTVQEGEKYDYSPTQAGSSKRAMPGSLHTTAEEIRKRGRKVLPIRLDLLDARSIDVAVEQSLREWGRIDLLLNNAIYQGPGIMDRFLDLPDELVKKVFEGMVFAQIHITQKILPTMLERGHGVIINMTSTAALTDPPAPSGAGGWGFGYGAAKGAFHRLAGILHVELRDRGIRSYNVEPGVVLTEVQQELFAGGTEWRAPHGPAPMAVPAAVIVWLATHPDAQTMSGQTIFAQPFCQERRLVPGWPPPLR